MNNQNSHKKIEYILGKPIDLMKVKKGVIDNCKNEVEIHRNNARKLLETKLFKTKSCPICNNREYEDVFSVKDIKWVKCKFCTHHFVLLFPNVTELSCLYERHANDGGLEPYRLETEKALKDRMENVDKPKYKVFLEHTKRNGRWLDVGAGLGNLLYIAKKDGWEVCGLELSEFHKEFAKRKFEIDLIQKDVIPFVEEDNPKHFDVITAMGYLDLIIDPVYALKVMKKIIKEDGLLIVSVPNANSFSARILQLWPESAIRLCAPFDRSLFTEVSLICALEKAGFVPFKCWYNGFDFFDLFLHLSIRNEEFKKSAVASFMLENFNDFQSVIDKNKMSDGMFIFSHVQKQSE